MSLCQKTHLPALIRFLAIPTSLWAVKTAASIKLQQNFTETNYCSAVIIMPKIHTTPFDSELITNHIP